MGFVIALREGLDKRAILRSLFVLADRAGGSSETAFIPVGDGERGPGPFGPGRMRRPPSHAAGTRPQHSRTVVGDQLRRTEQHGGPGRTGRASGADPARLRTRAP